MISSFPLSSCDELLKLYFFLGPLLAIGGLGAVLVLLPPFLDIISLPCVELSAKPRASAPLVSSDRDLRSRRGPSGHCHHRAAGSRPSSTPACHRWAGKAPWPPGRSSSRSR